MRANDFAADLRRDPCHRDVLGVVVAGSAARGEERWRDGRLDSDIDVMVIAPLALDPPRSHPRGRAGDRPPRRPRHRGRADSGRHPALRDPDQLRGPPERRSWWTATRRCWRRSRWLARSTFLRGRGSASSPTGCSSTSSIAPGSRTAEWAARKSYEAIGEAQLVLEGRYRPSFGERAEEIHRRPLGGPVAAASQPLPRGRGRPPERHGDAGGGCRHRPRGPPRRARARDASDTAAVLAELGQPARAAGPSPSAISPTGPTGRPSGCAAAGTACTRRPRTRSSDCGEPRSSLSPARARAPRRGAGATVVPMSPDTANDQERRDEADPLLRRRLRLAVHRAARASCPASGTQRRPAANPARLQLDRDAGDRQRSAAARDRDLDRVLPRPPRAFSRPSASSRGRGPCCCGR